MKDSTISFQDFELAGWSDDSVCKNYDTHYGSITTQSVNALLDAANVARNCRILDVCTGAGYAAGLAVQRGAIATGIDFSESQIQLAEAKYPGVEFQVCDATDLPYPNDSFDAVVNGIGMPHFEDPDAAIREAYRVLKPNGCFAFTVYDTPAKAVGFGILYSAIQEHGTMDIGLPVGPNFYLFSDSNESMTRLQTAGFEGVSITRVPQVWRLASIDELFNAVENGSVRAASTLQGQSAEAQQLIKAAVAEAMNNYKKGDNYELPMPAVLVSAIKPKQ